MSEFTDGIEINLLEQAEWGEKVKHDISGIIFTAETCPRCSGAKKAYKFGNYTVGHAEDCDLMAALTRLRENQKSRKILAAKDMFRHARKRNY